MEMDLECAMDFVVMDGLARQLGSAFDDVSLVEPIDGRYNTILHNSPSGVADIFIHLVVWVESVDSSSMYNRQPKPNI